MIPVQITSRALAEIKNTIATKNIPADYGLRVGARGGGCVGTSFIIGFDHRKESDMVYTIADLPVYVEKKDILFLLGTVVDFYEGNEARGFTFVKAHEESVS
jgi:iron-sulfur cluster assembly protein